MNVHEILFKMLMNPSQNDLQAIAILAIKDGCVGAGDATIGDVNQLKARIVDCASETIHEKFQDFLNKVLDQMDHVSWEVDIQVVPRINVDAKFAVDQQTHIG